MPLSQRPKTQLSIAQFTRPTTSHTSPKPEQPGSQPKKLSLQALPRPTIPLFFQSSPSTPKRRRSVDSLGEDAWKIAERLANGKKLTPRVSYGDEGRVSENSDTDFEADAIRHCVASERPSLKRKYAASGLRDDRASMTKRSTGGKVKKKSPVKVATQRSVAVIDSDESDSHNSTGRVREVLNEHEVVLVDGEKSELSGTDNEDADVSKYPEPLSRLGTRRRISLAGSMIKTVNEMRTDLGGKRLLSESPEGVSRGTNLNVRCENATRLKVGHVQAASTSGRLNSHASNYQKPTFGRSRDLVSMFDSESEDVPRRSPCSTRSRLKRSCASLSNSSQSENSDCEDNNATLKEMDGGSATIGRGRTRFGADCKTARRKITFESESEDTLRESGASQKSTEQLAQAVKGNGSASTVKNKAVRSSASTATGKSFTCKPASDLLPANEGSPSEDTIRAEKKVKYLPNLEKSKEKYQIRGNAVMLNDLDNKYLYDKRIDRNSLSPVVESDVVDVKSSPAEKDKKASDREAGSSCDEESETEHDKSQIMTRSAIRRASQSRRPIDCERFFDLTDEREELCESPKSSSGVVLDSKVASRESSDKECTPVKRRRSRRYLAKPSDKKFSVTPESTPSPPSTKRRFRLCKLMTRHSDSDDNAETFNSGEDGARVPQISASVEKQNHLPSSKTAGEWFHERQIGDFSHSSTDFQESNPVKERSSAIKSPFRLRKGSRSGTTHSVRRALFQSNPHELDDGNRELKAQETQTRGSGRQTLEDPVCDVIGEHSGSGNGAEDIIDLLDAEDTGDPLGASDDALESNSPNQVDEIRNSRSAGNSGSKENIAQNVVTDEDDNPPPFNLLIMCNPAESVRQMVERVGEEEIMDRVAQAQSEGRAIVGGEDLGLGESFNTGVFNKFSKTVVAEQIGRERKLKNVTEQALRGEYKFNYRGKEMEGQAWGSGRGGQKWHRGRRGRRRGGTGGGGRGRGGRLANLRRRRG